MAKVYGFEGKGDADRARRAIRGYESFAEPRPKKGRRQRRWGRSPQQTTSDPKLRGEVVSTIGAATGLRGQPKTPGFGQVRLYTPPEGPPGTPWQLGSVVTAENWMRGTIAAGKPVLLRVIRKLSEDEDVDIYEIIAEGCAVAPEE